MQLSQGSGQSAWAGAAVAVRRGVALFDRYGNPVPGHGVAFSVVTGGGGLSGSTPVTSDTNGVAIGPSWFLGKRNIPQRLAATTAGLTQNIDATIRTSMTVDVRFVGTMTDAQKTIFLGAAQRISAMVTSGAGPVQANGFPIATVCGITGAAPLTELIPGIIIYASIAPIDGAGNVLARSGPCGFRGASQGYQPAVAIMIFDSADLDALANGGSLEDVATHEAMHALGFGTLWSTYGLVAGSITDPEYVGRNGVAGCQAIGGAVTCATATPVENVGGSGTVGSHWREAVFGNELMTGYLNAGNNPLSVMSLASMMDLGYAVSLTAADSYSITMALRGRASVRSLPDNWEDVRLPISPDRLEPVGGLLRTRGVP